MDYEKLIDEETWHFIRDTARHFPDDSATRSIEDQRKLYSAMAACFRVPRPDVVEVSERTIGHVPVRLYEAGDPTRTVMYCHGGGFVVGDLNSHDGICAEMCAQTGYRVVAVDYRLAPENQHPAQFEDAWNVAVWIADTYPGGLLMAGDSAGATLCACVAHHARAHIEDVLGQVLIYPSLGGDMSKGSYIEHAFAPMLTKDAMAFYAGIRNGGAVPAGDPTYAPLLDSDFAGLPPTVLISADCDPLRDDCPAYCDKILEAGGKVHWINERGLVHGFLRGRHSIKRAAASFERITLAIEALGQGIWSYDEDES